MEVRDFALGIVTARTLEEKLTPPPAGLTDRSPGPALRLTRPGRPPELAIVPVRSAKVPRKTGMVDPAQRGRILHALANHELQAVELFAWALLAFPGADREFRRELVGQVAEEERHCRMYRDRLAALGVKLGDYPVSGYFWSKVKDFTSPLRFVCGVSLTFENANLDHAVEYARAARAAGDLETAALLECVHEDEVEHVRFGWRWLRRWKEKAQTMCDAYCANVTWPLRPALARGQMFHPEGREMAGIDPEFIRLLETSDRKAPLDQRRA